jgi:hypothetical protein
MDISDDPVPFFPPFQLSDLSVCKTPATGLLAFCNALSRSTALEMFACQHRPIRGEGAVALVRALSAWTAIHQLDLELCEMGDAGARALSAAVEVSPTLYQDSAARRVELSALEGPPEEEPGSDPDRIKSLIDEIRKKNEEARNALVLQESGSCRAASRKAVNGALRC